MAVRLTGSAAKNIAILLASVLKQEISQSNKTRGKARLTNMIKSGKELKLSLIHISFCGMGEVSYRLYIVSSLNCCVSKNRTVASLCGQGFDFII